MQKIPVWGFFVYTENVRKRTFSELLKIHLEEASNKEKRTEISSKKSYNTGDFDDGKTAKAHNFLRVAQNAS